MLTQHPDTWAFPDSEPKTSTDKEAHFWDRNHGLGVEWYRTLMTPPDPALKTMDFTPEYAFLPNHHIAECKSLSPEAKVIYILRDPIARLVSALRMHMLWDLGENADARLDRAMLDRYLHDIRADDHGSYMRNLDAWRRHYPNTLVINYEELHADRPTWVRRIMDHAGLNPGRMTGAQRAAFDTAMARKVWESKPFPVDRDVLVQLDGFTERTRRATRNGVGFEFQEGREMIEAAARDEAGEGDLGQMTSLLSGIRTELARLNTRATEQKKALDELLSEIKGVRQLNRMTLDNAMAARIHDIDVTYARHQMSMPETIDAVIDQRLSLTRFGDGELMMMVNPMHHLGFQTNSPELQEDLKNALNPNWMAPGRILVAMPPIFRGNPHWMTTWITTWEFVKEQLDPKRRYGHSLITRPEFFKRHGKDAVAQWRRVWQGRDVLIVTGKGSRFDIIPELFEGAGQIRFLHTVPEHAYAHRQSVVSAVQKLADPNTLVLLSLGPTATVLAHQIAALGLQALDIGHISASYANVFNAGPIPEQMRLSR